MSDRNDQPMTTGAWFLTMLLLSVPLLNLVLIVVWACGVGNISRVTFCRASILLVVISLLIYLVFSGFLIGVAHYISTQVG